MKKLLIKWYFLLPLGIILAIGLTIYLSNRSNTTLNPGEKNFAVTDTASVTRIFLADKTNQSVLLEKTDSAGWMLNGKYGAQPEMVDELLYTLMYATVLKPVPNTMKETVIRQLAAHAIKVEVYARVHFIDIFGVKLFPYEKCIRTYYVGAATQENQGNFMIMEDADMPFIVHIPGFRGFLHPRYSPRESDWRNHQVFKYTLPGISSVDVTYPTLPERSFRLENPDNINFSINNEKLGPLKPIDTIKVISYLNAFTDVRFETFLNEEPEVFKDSLKKATPFCIIAVTNRKGETNSIALHRIKALPGSVNLMGDPVEFDPERLYGILNGKDLVMTQYFVFGALMRYYAQFSPSNTEQTEGAEKFQTIF